MDLFDKAFGLRAVRHLRMVRPLTWWDYSWSCLTWSRPPGNYWTGKRGCSSSSDFEAGKWGLGMGSCNGRATRSWSWASRPNSLSSRSSFTFDDTLRSTGASSLGLVARPSSLLPVWCFVFWKWKWGWHSQLSWRRDSALFESSWLWTRRWTSATPKGGLVKLSL